MFIILNKLWYGSCVCIQGTFKSVYFQQKWTKPLKIGQEHWIWCEILHKNHCWCSEKITNKFPKSTQKLGSVSKIDR
jgi:hypothetical protein